MSVQHLNFFDTVRDLTSRMADIWSIGLDTLLGDQISQKFLENFSNVKPKVTSPD